MKKMERMAAVLLILVVGFGLGVMVDRDNETEAAIVVHGFGSESFAPLLIESITSEDVKDKLAAIEPLALYSGTYTVEKDMDFSRYFFENIRIPGVVNTVSFLCEGVVTVGYDVNGIESSVDTMNSEIRINLPKAEILDSYVIWGSVESLDEDNLIYPIAFPEYQKLMAEAEGDILAQAEAECIYEQAEVNVQAVIRNCLAGFDGYKVVFA